MGGNPRGGSQYSPRMSVAWLIDLLVSLPSTELCIVVLPTFVRTPLCPHLTVISSFLSMFWMFLVMGELQALVDVAVWHGSAS